MKLTLEECKALMSQNNGNLNLDGRTDVTELPNGLTVEGFLNICNTSIFKLPVDIQVKGSVYANDCELSELPENFIVKAVLTIMGSPITKLPKGLVVEQDFYATDTNLKIVPDDIVVKYRIFCSANSPLVNLAFQGCEIIIR